MQQGRIHYAWFILVACLGFYSYYIGVITSAQGVFYAPLMAETGWSRGKLLGCATTRAFTRVTSCMFVSTACANFAFAAIYDFTGSYDGMFVMMAAFFALSLVVLPIAIRKGSKVWR